MTFYERLTLLWRRFSPLEEQLLDAARHALAPSARRIFDAQVAAITRVQRHPDWTEIAFYRMRGGKVDWTDVPLFARREELPLVELRFRVGARAFKARLTAIGGHIFDFGVTPSPREVAFARWNTDGDARLLADPEEEGAAAPVEPLPDVWQAILEAHPASHPAWVVHGAGAVYRITQGEGEFLVLAESRGDAFLLWRLEPTPAAFFLQLAHDGRLEAVRGRVEEVLGRDPAGEPRR
jgi:hypothetical protein